jgi:hypothetical protein
MVWHFKFIFLMLVNFIVLCRQLYNVHCPPSRSHDVSCVSSTYLLIFLAAQRACIIGYLLYGYFSKVFVELHLD